MRVRPNRVRAAACVRTDADTCRPRSASVGSSRTKSTPGGGRILSAHGEASLFFSTIQAAITPSANRANSARDTLARFLCACVCMRACARICACSADVAACSGGGRGWPRPTTECQPCRVERPPLHEQIRKAEVRSATRLALARSHDHAAPSRSSLDRCAPPKPPTHAWRARTHGRARVGARALAAASRRRYTRLCSAC
jgi:hypothetical protein